MVEQPQSVPFALCHGGDLHAPATTRVAPVGSRAAECVARFDQRDGLVGRASIRQQERQIAVGLGVVVAEPDRRAQSRARAGEVLPSLQQGAERVVRPGVAGAESHGILERLERLVVGTALLQHVAEIDPGVGAGQ